MKGLPRSLGHGAENSPTQAVLKRTIRVKDLVVNVAATGVNIGFGTGVIGDFPEGNILLLGVGGYFSFAGPAGGSANLSDTWNGDYAVGTVPNADTTLTGTDVDVLPSTALGPATAEAVARTRAVNAVQAIFDNTDGSLELNLNVLVDAADIVDDTNVDLTVNGELYVVYAVLGDD